MDTDRKESKELKFKFLKFANEWLSNQNNNSIGNGSDSIPPPQDICIFIIGGWAVNRYVYTRNTQDIDIISNEERLTSLCSYCENNLDLEFSGPADNTIISTRKYNFRDKKRNNVTLEARFFNEDDIWFTSKKYPTIIIDKKWLYYGSDLFFERTYGAFDWIRIPSRFKLIALKILAVISRDIKNSKTKIVQDFIDIFALSKNLEKYYIEIIAVMQQINLYHHEPMTDFFQKLFELEKEIGNLDKNSFIYKFQEIGTPNIVEYISKLKVNSLNWKALSDEEKKFYYDTFITLVPKGNKPFYPTVSIDKQEELQLINKIDLEPLVGLIDFLNLPIDLIKIPITQKEHEQMQNFDFEVSRKLFGVVKNNENDLELLKYLDCIYDYLSMNEVDLISRGKNWDVTIVPGCRSDIEFRARAAYESHANQGVKNIIITGMHPYYDDTTIQITEAEAMEYVLTHRYAFNLSNVKISLETRARNTRENIIHSLPILQKLSHEKQRPLKILLTTSPYHMRRFYSLVKKTLIEYPNLVSEIGCRMSGTYFEKRTWYRGSTDKFPADYGTKLYIQEYFKLIGGRVTGEF